MPVNQDGDYITIHEQAILNVNGTEVKFEGDVCNAVTTILNTAYSTLGENRVKENTFTLENLSGIKKIFCVSTEALKNIHNLRYLKKSFESLREEAMFISVVNTADDEGFIKRSKVEDFAMVNNVQVMRG